MSISLGFRTPAQLAGVRLLGGARGLGFYRLVFEAHYQCWAAEEDKDPLTLQLTGGHVLAGRAPSGSTAHLGRLQLESGSSYTQPVNGQPGPAVWQFTLELPPERLAALERVRAGGDLLMAFKLHGEASCGAQRRFGVDDYTLTVTQSDWTRVLREVGYRDMLLLEVPVLGPAEDAPLAEAAARLQAARTFFIEGRYDSAVEKCRHVMEALGLQLEDGHGTHADLQPLLGDRKKLTKRQRLMALRYTLFTLTCLAAHSKDEVSIRTSWDRPDALAVLTMTASIVGWMAEEKLA